MNLLANLPTNLPDELTTVRQEGNGVRIERIVSTGHKSPEGFWYCQPKNEWVMVLTGAAKLAFEDRVVDMMPGDSINIPARQKPQVSPEIQLAPTASPLHEMNTDQRLGDAAAHSGNMLSRRSAGNAHVPPTLLWALAYRQQRDLLLAGTQSSP